MTRPLVQDFFLERFLFPLFALLTKRWHGSIKAFHELRSMNIANEQQQLSLPKLILCYWPGNPSKLTFVSAPGHLSYLCTNFSNPVNSEPSALGWMRLSRILLWIWRVAPCKRWNSPHWWSPYRLCYWIRSKRTPGRCLLVNHKLTWHGTQSSPIRATYREPCLTMSLNVLPLWS